MRGRRGLGGYTLGDRYTTPERRLSQMLMRQGSRGGPSDSWQETLGRIAQQLSGAYIGKLDQDKQDLANQTLAKVQPDEHTMQPTMNDQQIMESEGVQNILRQKTDADRMGNPMIQRNITAIRNEQDRIADQEQSLSDLQDTASRNRFTDGGELMQVQGPLTDKYYSGQIDRATQNIENYGDEFNQTMGRLRSQEPTDDQRAEAVRREILRQRRASEVNTLNEKMPQIDYALQNLLALKDNSYAQRLAQGLMMNKMSNEAASRLDAIARQRQLDDIQSGRDFMTSERLAGEKFKRGESAKSNLSAENVARGKSAFGNEDNLREEFNKGAKDFLKVRDAYGRIRASAKDPSAAGDLALIFNYMKVLDPGSTVREGEFATAQNSASIPERIWAKYNQVMRGERLTPLQRDDFVARAESLYNQQENFYKGHEKRYRDLATAYQLNPDRVVQGLNQGFIPEATPETGDAPTEIIEIPETNDQKELDALRKWKAGQLR